MCKGKFLYFRLIAARGGNILIESCRFPRGIVIDRGGRGEDRGGINSGGIVIDRGGGGEIEEVLIVGGDSDRQMGEGVR